MTSNRSDAPKLLSSSLAAKLLVLACVIGGGVLGYWFVGGSLTLSELARRELQLRQFQHRQPVLVYAVAFLIYVIVTGASLPGATALSLAYGWYFSFWRAFILVSFSSTAGATVAFLLSRYLFRDAVQRRFGERLRNFNQAWERDGPFYLFSLRLIPAVPFFMINVVMGLTPIRTRTFWWVSQLGMLPGTAVYVYAGASVPSLHELAAKGVGAAFTPVQLTQLVIAFVLLGLFPITMRWAMKLISRS